MRVCPSIVPSFRPVFLDASTHLYKRVCLSVRLSLCRCVCHAVRFCEFLSNIHLCLDRPNSRSKSNLHKAPMWNSFDKTESNQKIEALPKINDRMVDFIWRHKKLDAKFRYWESVNNYCFAELKRWIMSNELWRSMLDQGGGGGWRHYPHSIKHTFRG